MKAPQGASAKDAVRQPRSIDTVARDETEASVRKEVDHPEHTFLPTVSFDASPTIQSVPLKDQAAEDEKHAAAAHSP